MDVKDVLTEIADDKSPLLHAHLADLSQISIKNLSFFRETWRTIPNSHRRKIISRLHELAEDNIELNFDLIFRYCLNDTDASVRKIAIESLWENEDVTLIRAFTHLLLEDPDFEVQAEAAIALGKFVVKVELEDIDQNYGEKLQKILLSIFSDKSRDTEVRRRALEAAAPLSVAAVKDAICQAYESRDERLVVSALYSMGKTCDSSWLPVLYIELANPDPEIRYEAAGALGEIGDENAITHLHKRINDADIDVRLAVIRALSQIGGPEAKHILSKIRDDSNVAIKEAVTSALNELQQNEDLSILKIQPFRGHSDKR